MFLWTYRWSSFKKEYSTILRIFAMRSIISKKLAAVSFVIFGLVLALVVWQVLPSLQEAPAPSISLPELTLTLVGASGQQVVLHQEDLAALTSYTGKGGTKSSAGAISSIGEYTGVPVLTLCDLVGGVSPENTLTISASDGYSMVYTYNQMHGQDFTMFDPVTGDERQPTQPVTLTLCYNLNGSALPPNVGPIRMGLLGEEGLLAEGHFWTYWVTRIEITANVRNWNVSVDVTGITSLDMDRQSYTSILFNSPLSWTDSSDNVWKGVALWRWVLWTNYHGGVSNDSLNKGYTLEVISGSGDSVVFEDSRVKLNDNLIVASQINGAPLSYPYWPLTLVGPEVPSREMIKNIAQMRILLDNSSPSPSLTPSSSTIIPSTPPSTSPTALPTETLSSSPTTTLSPTTLPDLTLTIIGSDGTQKTLHANDISALAKYSAYGGTRSSSGTLANLANYTGVPILTLCNLVGGVTSSGTVKVTASDGYSVTYSFAQLNGQDIIAYDSAGNQVTPSKPLTMIVAYLQDGVNLPEDVGPLRIIIVGPEGLYTSGSINARLVVKIEVLN
jgi:hypothetical protein